MKDYIVFCMLGELESVLHGNRMLVFKKSLTNMGFPCCCEFAFVLHGIPMLRAFRLLFLMFTWETHIKGHKKKPPTWKNYVNFEI